MTDYTPTTREVRDAVLMAGKPFDQIGETDDPHYGYQIYDIFVEPGAAFDRWLRSVKSDAFEQGFYVASDGQFFPEPGENPYREEEK